MNQADIKAVINAIDECVIAYGANGDIVVINSNAMELTGLLSTEECCRVTSIFIDLMTNSGVTLEILKQHASLHTQWGVKSKEGIIIPVTVSIRQLDLSENCFYTATIKQHALSSDANSALVKAANYARTLLDTVIDGLITIDSKGNIREFNKSAERIFGYQAYEVQGKNVKVLMPSPYHEEHDGYLANYHHTQTKKVIGLGRQVKAQKKDGTVFPIELGVNEMISADEVVYVGTIRDVSERHEAEKEIQNYISALKLSNQELDQFAYIASHDLKEPLRGVANNALFLEEDFFDILDDSGKRRITRMRFLCQRMEELVNSLLYYSRLGRQELAVECKSIQSIIEKVKEITLPDDDPSIVLTCEPNLPDVVVDVPKAVELFRNLITNALKYNNNDKKIINIGRARVFNPVLSIEEEAFYVQDNGIGIDRQFHSDVFRIFKRINDENDDKRGTGVGLTFVKKIIERHNGHIWVESELGKGATFYFTLKLEA